MGFFMGVRNTTQIYTRTINLNNQLSLEMSSSLIMIASYAAVFSVAPPLSPQRRRLCGESWERH